MHFLSIWRKDFRDVVRDMGDLRKEENVRKLVDAMFQKHLHKGMQQGIWFWRQIQDLRDQGIKESLYSRILAAGERNPGEIFRILIEEATRLRPSKRLVVKFPVYPTYIRRLADWYPEAPIIHISRDPRALAASKTNDPGGTAKLRKKFPLLKALLPLAGKYFAVFQYILTSYVHSRYKNLRNYRHYSYEELLSHPESVIRDLCEFCDLQYEESMLDPSSGQASSITGERTSGLDAARIDGWKSVLSSNEAGFIRVITKGSMYRFGCQARETR